ncbi:MAG: hypothetical protein EOP37_00850 [Rubrivivax sp.]|nr:MAG: hypothetical protein EOP37_00850 [Rubrivivax sp.]
MTVQLNYVRPISRADKLVTIMVMPVPTPEGMSELAAVLDLLRYPAELFGACQPQGLLDAQCVSTSWEEIDRALCELDRRNVTVTYVRHVLHLAAHFARRHGLQRCGTATATLFESKNLMGIEYGLPLAVGREAALEWTSEFWGELAYVDLLRSEFLFSFVSNATA